MRRRTDRRWIVAIALAAILVGSLTLVLADYQHPSDPRTTAQPATSSRHHGRSRSAAADRRPHGESSVMAAASSDPAAAADTSVAGTLPGAHLAPVAVQGTPSNIVDPSEVARAEVSELPLYSSPGAATPEGTMANPNYLGAPLVLLVTAVQGNWIQAYVPERPNEATAWVPEADVSLSTVPCHIGIGISSHKLVLYCNNAAVFSADVATGAPSSPTPTGSFFVAYIVELTDPGGPYGPYALGTSAFSNTYYSFEGGPGQIGIHGTDEPWVIGSYASHGCVRLNNSAITTLAQQVQPGTPVEIGP